MVSPARRWAFGDLPFGSRVALPPEAIALLPEKLARAVIAMVIERSANLDTARRQPNTMKETRNSLDFARSQTSFSVLPQAGYVARDAWGSSGRATNASRGGHHHAAAARCAGARRESERASGASQSMGGGKLKFFAGRARMARRLRDEQLDARVACGHIRN